MKLLEFYSNSPNYKLVTHCFRTHGCNRNTNFAAAVAFKLFTYIGHVNRVQLNQLLTVHTLNLSSCFCTEQQPGQNMQTGQTLATSPGSSSELPGCVHATSHEMHSRKADHAPWAFTEGSKNLLCQPFRCRTLHCGFLFRHVSAVLSLSTSYVLLLSV